MDFHILVLTAGLHPIFSLQFDKTISSALFACHAVDNPHCRSLHVSIYQSVYSVEYTYSIHTPVGLCC